MVPDLATSAGFSRFHLARLFHQTAEETLEQFLRRIRLERAAYMLLNSDLRVFQIARGSGYRSPEAFSRAFRQAYGCLPTEAKQCIDDWEIPSASNLHWNADWVLTSQGNRYDDQVISMPARMACVFRTVGDYALLSESWNQLLESYKAAVPNNAKFVTIYHDNFLSHPVCRTMTADIGWLCPPDVQPPSGMRRKLIPTGSYAATRWVDRAERTDAWSYMLGRYSAARSRVICYDEYANVPVPFNEVMTRLLVSTTP